MAIEILNKTINAHTPARASDIQDIINKINEIIENGVEKVVRMSDTQWEILQDSPSFPMWIEQHLDWSVELWEDEEEVQGATFDKATGILTLASDASFDKATGILTLGSSSSFNKETGILTL